MRRTSMSRSAGRPDGPLRLSLVPRVAGLVALCVAASCATVSKWFEGPFRLQVVPRQMEDVISVFVVVTEEANLEGWDDPDRVRDVVAPDNQSKAVTFVQFRPEKRGGRWDFEDLGATTVDPNVEYGVDEEDPVVVVKVERELLESFPELAAAVVVNRGVEGWDAVRIRASEIERSDGARVEVGGGGLRKTALTE